MRIIRLAVLAMMLGALQACASIIEGTSQTITVETTPTGASCRFYREGMAIASVETPGGVVVEKTKHDLVVECEKQGYETAKANLDSGIAGATWGNILLGGGIGWAIDSAAGADNEYPEYVNLTLPPKSDIGMAKTLAAPLVPGVWHTINDNVLAYSEFSGKGESLRMPTAVRLEMKHEKEDWGLFEYDASEGSRSRAWILLGNVEQKLSDPN